MPNLTKFLLARIAEDKQAAQYAADENLEATWEPDKVWEATRLPRPMASHMARWDPARVLAECEAKKNLVNYAAFMLKAWDDKHAGRESAYPDMTRRERHTAHVILESLAQVYADHPDYNETWRVE